MKLLYLQYIFHGIRFKIKKIKAVVRQPLLMHIE